MNLEPHKRFSDRVQNYLRYRPHYPEGIIPTLEDAGVLTDDSIIADLGCGTGFLAQLFLNHGCEVYGIEPNADMRAAGEEYLSEYSSFHSLNGSAENTGLNEDSIDLVTVGQAFHWFDIEATRREILRITLPPHWLAVVFNDRDLNASDFMREYDEVLHQYAPNYRKIRDLYLSVEEFSPVFGHTQYKHVTLPYEQRLNESGLIGRVLSSSYIPLEGQAGHDELISALKELFNKYQKSQQVVFSYKTTMVHGKTKKD